MRGTSSGLKYSQSCNVSNVLGSALMDSFYTHLAAGERVEEALRLAARNIYLSATHGAMGNVAAGTRMDDINEDEHEQEDPPPMFNCDGCQTEIEVHWQRMDGVDFDLCDRCYQERPDLRPANVTLLRLDGNQQATAVDPEGLSFHPSAWAPFTLILNTL